MEDRNDYIQDTIIDSKDMSYELEPAPQPPSNTLEPVQYELEPAPQPSSNTLEPVQYEVLPYSEVQ
jgi:hypothetical protein